MTSGPIHKRQPASMRRSAAIVLIQVLIKVLFSSTTSADAAFTHSSIKECISNSSAYFDSLAEKGPVTSEQFMQVLLGTFACAGVNADTAVSDRKSHGHSAMQGRARTVCTDFRMTRSCARWSPTPSPLLL